MVSAAKWRLNPAAACSRVVGKKDAKGFAWNAKKALNLFSEFLSKIYQALPAARLPVLSQLFGLQQAGYFKIRVLKRSIQGI